MDVVNQILAAIQFSYATAIITAAGTALIGLGFLAFVFRKGQEAANGRIGEEFDDDEEDD